MLYSRYAKFLKSVANNRRPALRGLLNTAVGSCQSVVGGNIRTVLVDTNIKIVPGVTTPAAFKNYQVYETPPGSEWKLPLLVSLLEMKDSRWSVTFDEETGSCIGDDEITTMIDNVCLN